jgi:hypothetical protein
MRLRTVTRHADMNPDHLTQMLTARAHVDGERTPVCPDDHDIAGYVDGGLDELPREQVERHLADCTYCLRLVALLSRAGPDEASAEAVLPQLETPESTVVQPVSQRPWRLAPQWAAAAVLILGIPILLQLSRTTDRGLEGQGRPVSPLTRNAPSVVSLQVLSPSAGETIDPRELTFHWTEVAGTPFYDVRVVTDAGDIVVAQRIEGTTWQPPPRLDFHRGAEYFVRIDAYPSGDKSVSSDHVPFRISD